MKLAHVVFAAFVSLGVAHAHGDHSISSHEGGNTPKQDESHRRLNHVVEPGDSIASELSKLFEEGVKFPQITIKAQANDDPAASRYRGLRSLTAGNGTSTYEVDLTVTQASVDGDTIVTDATGTSHKASELPGFDSKTFLVSSNPDVFAFVSVDSDTGYVTGIVRKAGDQHVMKIVQESGGNTTVTADPRTREWKCHVGDSLDDGATGHRHLHQDYHDDNDGDHEDHGDHYHSHTHDHEPHQDWLMDIQSSLKSTKALRRLQQSRGDFPTDSFPKLYTYEVGIFIEIDSAVVNNNGGINGAKNYVDALVTAASKIYEREVDTRLRVVEIVESTFYDSFATISDALEAMGSNFETSDTWTSRGVGIHHALLGGSHTAGWGGLANNEGGDNQFGESGVVCNPQWGYSIVGESEGDINRLDGTMFWDLNAFAHEIGHNFGAAHPHSMEPQVDSCDVKGSGGRRLQDLPPGTCPSGIPSPEGRMTIMSYCDLCDNRSVAQTGETFGGSWKEGDRNDIDSWVNDQNIGAFHVDAKRIPFGMWKHISKLSRSDSTATCVKPIGPVPSVTCFADTDCNDGNSCTDDICDTNTNQCINTMRDGICCGNGICETGEASTCALDCGRTLSSIPFGLAGFIASGIMFDVEATNDIFVQSVAFVPTNSEPSGTPLDLTVNIYTKAGSFSGSQTDRNAWRQIFSNQVSTKTDTPTEITFPDVEVVAGAKQAFYVATNGALFVGDETINPLRSDANMKILNPDPDSAIDSPDFSQFFSGPSSFIGEVSYRLPETATVTTTIATGTAATTPATATITTAATTGTAATTPAATTITTAATTTTMAATITTTPASADLPAIRDDSFIVLVDKEAFLNVLDNDSVKPGAGSLRVAGIRGPGVLPVQGTFPLTESPISRGLEIGSAIKESQQVIGGEGRDKKINSDGADQENGDAASEPVHRDLVQQGNPSLNGFCNPTDDRKRVRYMPNPGFTGYDFCTYVACDEENICGEARITLIVVQPDPYSTNKPTPYPTGAGTPKPTLKAIQKYTDVTPYPTKGEKTTPYPTAEVKNPTPYPTRQTKGPTPYPTTPNPTSSVYYSASARTDPQPYGGTGKWYLRDFYQDGQHYNDQYCVRDCEPGGPQDNESTSQCGGIVQASWVKTFDSLDACCAGKLSWLDIDLCRSNSNPSKTGSDKYWGDQAQGFCKKDCDLASDPKCQRAPASINVYDTIDQCCKFSLPWIDQKFCNSRSSQVYTNGWYADWSGMKCAQDCHPSSGDTCKALTEKEKVIFDTPMDCCNKNYSWMGMKQCVAASTGVPHYSQEWYVDWRKNLCVKDCDPRTGHPCAGNPKDTWDSSFPSARQCCSARLSWVNEEYCVGASSGPSAHATANDNYYPKK